MCEEYIIDILAFTPNVNMRNYLLIIVLGFFFIACRKSGLTMPEPKFKIDSINRALLLGTANIHSGYNPFGSTDAFVFNYDNRKNFRSRIGGFFNVVYSGGSSGIFSPDVYDTVIYRNNTIEVSTHSRNGFYVDPNKRRYTLSNSKIQLKITYASDLTQGNDTAFFYYGTNQNLDKVVEKFSGSYTISTFSFNSLGNLDSVLSKTYRTGDNTLLWTIAGKFGDYDNSINPLKYFGIWDETFYRSLTRNNFRSYHYQKTYGTSIFVSEYGDFKFHLQYDSKGMVDFTK